MEIKENRDRAMRVMTSNAQQIEDAISSIGAAS
jgi:hypothetical protein